MERCSPLGARMLDVLLLLSASIVSQTAAEPRLRCVNDYVFTINCSLAEASEEAVWLYVVSDYWDQTTTWCRLTEVDGGQFCSIHISSLVSDDGYLEELNDLQSFNVSLCGSEDANTCRLLIEDYAPNHNIKPNAPCCLRLSHNSSRHNFTWRSTYEEYSHTALGQNMQYQLHYYARGQGNNISFHQAATESTNYSLSDKYLLPGVEYGARVRSMPNQGHYRGEWSDWSSEIHWKTEPAEPDVISISFLSELGIQLFLLCIMALLLLLLLLSFACVKMWRRAYIPTPAAYFHTLYNDYHGDFKSWVVTPDKMADALKVEEILQTDTVTKCVDVQELGPRSPSPQTQQEQEAMYGNIAPPGCDGPLLGVPYAVSTAAPAEDSSACWMCSRQGLESNEYCSLSAFHQAHGCSRGPVDEQQAQYEN